MIRRLSAAAVLVSVFMLFPACTKPAPKPEPVAVVNGKEINRETFDLYLNERIASHKSQNVTPDSEKLRNAVLQELISEMLILERASANGIVISDDELSKELETIKQRMGEDNYQKSLKEKGLTPESFRERTRDKMAMIRLKESLVTEDGITDEEVKEFYESSEVPFLKPERVFMRMIEFQGEEAAAAVAAEIREKKADFDKIADSLAQDNKAIVSDYGWISPDVFSPEIAGAMKNVKVNDFGGPFKGARSYFLIRVKDREEEGISTLEEVSGDIRRMILEQKRQATLAHLIAESKKKADIKILLK